MSADVAALARIRALIFGIRADRLRAEPEESSQPGDDGTGLSWSGLLIEPLGGSLMVIREVPTATSFKGMILDPKL